MLPGFYFKLGGGPSVEGRGGGQKPIGRLGILGARATVHASDNYNIIGMDSRAKTD